MKAKSFLLFALTALLFASCKQETPSLKGYEKVPPKQSFYLLNQGNMGTNKASLDFYNSKTKLYTTDFFAHMNPAIKPKLGDVANDMKIYGSKLYITVMGSNLVEIVDKNSGIHIAEIDLEKCRYVNFYGGKVYVTSYAGSGENGIVAEIDTTSLTITRTCNLGRNPEEMAIIGSTMYVINSGGYYYPTYDNKLSVVDLNTFTETEQIALSTNMSRIKATTDSRLFISSYGNYSDIAGDLIIFNPQTKMVEKSFGIAAAGLDIVNSTCYCYSCVYDASWNATYKFYSIDTATGKIKGSPIKDGTDANFQAVYSIVASPSDGSFFVCDAADYVSPGTVSYYSADGILNWKQYTGDIPCAITFK